MTTTSCRNTPPGGLFVLLTLAFVAGFLISCGEAADLVLGNDDCVVAPCPPPAPAPPPPPPPVGAGIQVLFTGITALQNFDFGLLTVGDPSTIEVLTSNGGHKGWQAISPDGTRTAFVNTTGQCGDLQVFVADRLFVNEEVMEMTLDRVCAYQGNAQGVTWVNDNVIAFLAQTGPGFMGGDEPSREEITVFFLNVSTKELDWITFEGKTLNELSEAKRRRIQLAGGGIRVEGPFATANHDGNGIWLTLTDESKDCAVELMLDLQIRSQRCFDADADPKVTDELRGKILAIGFNLDRFGEPSFAPQLFLLRGIDARDVDTITEAVGPGEPGPESAVFCGIGICHTLAGSNEVFQVNFHGDSVGSTKISQFEEVRFLRPGPDRH
jgi:hypothetical protein